MTNSSLNKHSQQYVPNVDAEEDASGSKWSLAALKRQVARDFGEARAASAWEQIDDLVVKTVISVEPAMSAGTRAFVPRCAGARTTRSASSSLASTSCSTRTAARGSSRSISTLHSGPSHRST